MPPLSSPPPLLPPPCHDMTAPNPFRPAARSRERWYGWGWRWGSGSGSGSARAPWPRLALAALRGLAAAGTTASTALLILHLLHLLLLGGGGGGLLPRGLLLPPSRPSRVPITATALWAEAEAVLLLRELPPRLRSGGRRNGNDDDDEEEEVRDIFWLHVQKCGTSLFNALLLHFCPDVLGRHPDLVLDGGGALIEYDLVRRFPQDEYCPQGVRFRNWPRVGFHFPYPADRSGTGTGTGTGTGLAAGDPPPPSPPLHTFAMLRDPDRRLRSAFAFREHSRLGVPHYSRLGDPSISLAAYASEPQVRRERDPPPTHDPATGLYVCAMPFATRELTSNPMPTCLPACLPACPSRETADRAIPIPHSHPTLAQQIPNCQTKMVLGYRCMELVPPPRLDLGLALRRIAAPNFFFGLTDRWEESLCLFHSWYGGTTQPYELANNRPSAFGGGREREQDGTGIPPDVDAALFAGATVIFDARIEAAGCASGRGTS